MTIENYGVILKRLTEDQLEMVRNWRNSPPVRSVMEYQEFISSEQQKSWFKTIDNNNNFYFVIGVDAVYIGLVHLSSIDYKQGHCHAGLFIGDSKYAGTPYPVSASLSILDFAFYVLNLDIVFAKVKADNQVALQYNLGLGFEIVPETANSLYPQMKLNRERFERHTTSLQKAGKQLYPGDRVLDYNSDLELKEFVEGILN